MTITLSGYSEIDERKGMRVERRRAPRLRWSSPVPDPVRATTVIKYQERLIMIEWHDPEGALRNTLERKGFPKFAAHVCAYFALSSTIEKVGVPVDGKSWRALVERMVLNDDRLAEDELNRMGFNVTRMGLQRDQ